VSVGLRKLQMEGKVESGAIDRGSRVWNLIRVPANA